MYSAIAESLEDGLKRTIAYFEGMLRAGLRDARVQAAQRAPGSRLLKSATG